VTTLPVRAILPALVSLLSGLWAVIEWRASRSDVLDVVIAGLDSTADDGIGANAK